MPADFAPGKGRRSEPGAGLEPRRIVRACANRAAAHLKRESRRHLYLPEVMRAAELSPDALAQLQLRRLRDLLRYAQGKVPYWESCFREVGFSPEDVRSVEDLRRLPVLTKDTIRENLSAMVSRDFGRGSLIERRTGGSSGTPLTFYVDRDSFERQMAVHLRGFRLVGYRPGDKMAKIWGYRRGHGIENRLLSPLTGRVFLDAMDASDESMGRWHALMLRHRPRFIYAYATAAHRFARFVRQRGLPPPPGLEVVCTTAEMLQPEMREEMTEGLGARVVDMYGAHEVVRIASECEHGAMHVATDGVVLELGPELEEGRPGRRVYVTSLFSKGMPLIRYDLGDYASEGFGRCSCGLPFPKIEMDVGKVHCMFPFPGGRRAHGSFFTKDLYPMDCLKEFQVRQKTAASVMVYAVPLPGRASEATRRLAGLFERWKREVGSEVSFEAVLADTVPVTERGKRPSAVSEVAE